MAIVGYAYLIHDFFDAEFRSFQKYTSTLHPYIQNVSTECLSGVLFEEVS